MMKNVIGRILLVLVVLIAGMVGIQLLRQSMAAAAMEREWSTIPQPPADLGSTARLELVPLFEADGDAQQFVTGHGVSYLIRTDGGTVLLDVGDNPAKSAQSPFLQNMQKLGIDWEEIDRIVISHPHPDHMGGVDAWSSGYVSLGSQPVGLSAKLVNVPVNLKGRDLVMAQDPNPFVVVPGVATIGVVPYAELFPMSIKEPKGSEQALVVNVTGHGLVLITGCGHPTLERLVERAEAVYGEPVVGIVGGLHYGMVTAEEVQPHITFLSERQPQLVALSPHDSGSAAIGAFRAAFPEAYQSIRVGEAIQFP